MKKSSKNHIRKLASAGLGAFLVLGLNGCGESKANCKRNAQYAPDIKKALDQCEENDRYVNSKNLSNNTSSTNHNSGSSWVPMWLMMNNNSHSGYSYGSGESSKTSGYYATGGSHSSSSGG